MANEPGAAVRAIFAQLIDRIKERTPIGTNDKPTGRKVYSQLVLGMPIDRRDYMNPWSPVGGASFRDVAAGTADAPPVADPQVLQAMQAAWKTSLLCKTMLAVTKDGAYREYPIGRHLDFAYEAILKGMTPAQIPEESEDIKSAGLMLKKCFTTLIPMATQTFLNAQKSMKDISKMPMPWHMQNQCWRPKMLWRWPILSRRKLGR